MPPNFSRVVNNPLYTATHSLPAYNNLPFGIKARMSRERYNSNNSRAGFSPLQARTNRPSELKTLRRENGKRNLGTGRYTPVKKRVTYSNGSRPGNNINNSLPMSSISATSNKRPGAYVVPPTRVENAYSKKPNVYNEKSYREFNAGNDPEENDENFFKPKPSTWYPWSKSNKVLNEVSSSLKPKPTSSWNPFGGRRTRKNRSHRSR